METPRLGIVMQFWRKARVLLVRMSTTTPRGLARSRERQQESLHKETFDRRRRGHGHLMPVRMVREASGARRWSARLTFTGTRAETLAKQY